MSEALVEEREGDELSAGQVLDRARAEQAVEDRAAARKLLLAAQWADLHPPESVHDAASFEMPGTMTTPHTRHPRDGATCTSRRWSPSGLLAHRPHHQP